MCLELAFIFAKLTPPITRLRASKATFNAKVTPQAQPISKKRRIAIRVMGIVSWTFTPNHHRAESQHIVDRIVDRRLVMSGLKKAR